MAEEFEYQDLSDASFWGVDLHRATFRDVDLTGVRISHARLVDVGVDGEIDRLVINGVDVTDYVNERDEWFALRSQVRITDPDGARAAWLAHTSAWGRAIERASRLSAQQQHVSVDGEWSFVQTVRHLVFATDKWFTVPVIGGDFHPLGLPNTGSADFPFPGVDTTAEPTFDDAVATWLERAERLRSYLALVPPDAWSPDTKDADGSNLMVDVLENGASTIQDCVEVVFEEHFEHLRYASRDLDRLT